MVEMFVSYLKGLILQSLGQTHQAEPINICVFCCMFTISHSF